METTVDLDMVRRIVRIHKVHSIHMIHKVRTVDTMHTFHTSHDLLHKIGLGHQGYSNKVVIDDILLNITWLKLLG